MKRKIIALAILCLLAISELASAQVIDSIKAKRIIISTSALEYIPFRFNSGNFNVGTELYLKNRYSIYANIGAIRSYGESTGWFPILKEKTNGIKIQIEGKRFLNRHKIFEPAILLFWPHIIQYKSQNLPNSGYYVAINSFYQTTTTKKQDFAQYSTVDRSVSGLNVRLGYQCIKRRGLTIDYAVGVGIQYIDSHSNNLINSDSYWFDTQKDFPWNKQFSKGSGIFPDITYQIRIGWGF